MDSHKCECSSLFKEVREYNFFLSIQPEARRKDTNMQGVTERNKKNLKLTTFSISPEGCHLLFLSFFFFVICFSHWKQSQSLIRIFSVHATKTESPIIYEIGRPPTLTEEHADLQYVPKAFEHFPVFSHKIRYDPT